MFTKRLLNPLRILVLTGGFGFVANPAAAEEPVAPVQDLERHLWAYPDGIIVSANGPNGKVARHKTFKPEFAGLMTTVSYLLRVCAVEERQRLKEWQSAGAKFIVTLTFGIDKDGSTNGLTMNASPAKSAPACFDAARQAARSARFTAGATEKPVKGSATFEIVSLADKDAQGRGYQYYAAERDFERRLKDNAFWFTCNADADCTVVTTKCTTRGVNKLYMDAFLKVLAERPTPTCRGDRNVDSQVLCRQKICTIARPR